MSQIPKRVVAVAARGPFCVTLHDGAARVKKLIAFLCLAALAACHSAPKTVAPAPVLRGNQTGAAGPQLAIDEFLAAAKNQDLQAMGALWGGPDGPARDLMPRNELEKRELIMMCYLKHDTYAVIGDAPNPGGSRAYVVSLSYKDLTRSTTFQLVTGPRGRWYVKDVDVIKLNDICARKG